jgi:hypothetical protein
VNNAQEQMASDKLMKRNLFSGDFEAAQLRNK